ncbi:hypothetical protein Dimus_008483 [Dionaea muscipula]
MEAYACFQRLLRWRLELVEKEGLAEMLWCCEQTLASAIVPHADGFIREEVRVLPTVKGALRPQPTDGLWQPLSSPVEPVSGIVEKDTGLLVAVRLLRLSRRRPGAVGLASSATSAGGGHSDSTPAS